MHPVPGILLGAICSGGTCLCLGTVLFRRLHFPFERIERLSLAFVAGAACFSQIVFLLCSVGLSRTNVFLAIALFSLGAAVSHPGITKQSAFSGISLPYKLLFGGLFFAFGVVYLVNAMAPEMSPDGS